MGSRFQMEVVATKPGFYGDRQHFEAGSLLNPARAGQKFTIYANALRYDEDGKMEVEQKNGKLYPILPTWMKPLHDVEPIDPKVTPHVVIDMTKKRKALRQMPQEAKDAAPVAYPKNMKKRLGPDPERVIKIARRGGGEEENDED